MQDAATHTLQNSIGVKMQKVTMPCFLLIVLAIASPSVRGASLYWTQNGDIYHANMDGSNVAPIYTRGPSDFLTAHLDVDLQNRHIYWLGVYPSGPYAIRRSDLDGQNIQDVITSGLGPAAVYGLAVDAVNQKLYTGSHVS
ncbi:MAG: hypothetical protein KF708_21625, partial [Pirellulales bacterium]|nr:hypothetical protein [Pirellulales bacterium]